MKRVLTWLIAFGMMLSFAGCGADSVEETETTGKNTGGYWIVTKSVSFANGQESDRSQYTYDEQGRLLDVICHRYGDWDRQYAYKYNENGYLSEIILCNEDGGYKWSEDAYQYARNPDGGYTINFHTRIL